MKITRAIEINDTILNVSGNYKKILDPEGPIAEQETFDINKIIDDGLDVTDLFTDYYSVIEKEVIAVIASEDPADYPIEDDDVIEQETLDALKDIFTDNANVNYELNNNSDKQDLIPSQSIPIHYEDDVLFLDKPDVIAIVNDLNKIINVMNKEEDRVIAANVSVKGIRLVRLSEITKIK